MYHHLVKDGKGRVWWSAWERGWGVVEGARAIDGKASGLEVTPGAGRVCSLLVPVGEGNKVLVNVGGKGASIVAFDKDKGDVLWQALDDPASYSSPIAFGEGADRQVIFLTSQGLVSLAPDDGKVFWQFPLKDLLSESSTTPVKVGDVLLGSSVI